MKIETEGLDCLTGESLTFIVSDFNVPDDENSIEFTVYSPSREYKENQTASRENDGGWCADGSNYTLELEFNGSLNKFLDHYVNQTLSSRQQAPILTLDPY